MNPNICDGHLQQSKSDQYTSVYYPKSTIDELSHQMNSHKLYDKYELEMECENETTGHPLPDHIYIQFKGIFSNIHKCIKMEACLPLH